MVAKRTWVDTHLGAPSRPSDSGTDVRVIPGSSGLKCAGKRITLTPLIHQQMPESTLGVTVSGVRVIPGSQVMVTRNSLPNLPLEAVGVSAGGARSGYVFQPINYWGIWPDRSKPEPVDWRGGVIFWGLLPLPVSRMLSKFSTERGSSATRSKIVDISLLLCAISLTVKVS